MCVILFVLPQNSTGGGIAMRTMHRQATKRAVALGVLLCFIAVSLLSEAFILMHSHRGQDHFAASGECALCVHIQSAENLLKRFGAALVIAPLGLFSFFAAPLLFSAAFSIACQTPVLLKIRLNN